MSNFKIHIEHTCIYKQPHGKRCCIKLYISTNPGWPRSYVVGITSTYNHIPRYTRSDCDTVCPWFTASSTKWIRIRENRRRNQKWTIQRQRLHWVQDTEQINVRENRRDNQEWTIQRHWQHWAHKTQNKDKQTKWHYTCYYRLTLENILQIGSCGIHLHMLNSASLYLYS